MSQMGIEASAGTCPQARAALTSSDSARPPSMPARPAQHGCANVQADDSENRTEHNCHHKNAAERQRVARVPLRSSIEGLDDACRHRQRHHEIGRVLSTIARIVALGLVQMVKNGFSTDRSIPSVFVGPTSSRSRPAAGGE